MAVITVQQIIVGGIEAVYSSADVSGDVFTNDGKTLIHVKNDDADTLNITVTAQKTSVDKQGFGTVAVSDTTVAITAGEEEFIGPFPTSRFNDSNGQVNVLYDDETSVTLAALRL